VFLLLMLNDSGSFSILLIVLIVLTFFKYLLSLLHIC